MATLDSLPLELLVKCMPRGVSVSPVLQASKTLCEKLLRAALFCSIVLTVPAAERLQDECPDFYRYGLAYVMIERQLYSASTEELWHVLQKSLNHNHTKYEALQAASLCRWTQKV